jgi:5-methylcytosine-specific restriction endonuclease McrBC regulatory subunit McrC
LNNTNKHITHLKESTCIGNELSYDIIQFVNSQVVSKNSFFHFSDKERDAEPVFNYYNNQWWVNRFVGEISFTFQEEEYQIIIKPRFGELFLFELLEIIFNFKFAKSKQSLSKSDTTDDYIKRIIAKIWLSKLIQANKYGLPRTNKKKVFSGAQIKGKLEVRDSILPYKNNNKLISSSYEKTINPDIASLLYETFKKLSKSYGLPQINKLPKNAIQIIHQLELARGKSLNRQSFYDTSKLPKIYQSFKEVLDLSISILANKTMNNQASNKHGYAFFLDMAEIWEMYLLKIFQEKFKLEGWQVESETIQSYKGSFYSRKLIPDIVLSKGNKVAVFDAKYKLMKGHYLDVDRSDFFQIHTYKAYYNKKNQLIISGLFYPITSNNIKKEPVNSILNDYTKFVISGIKIEDIDSTEDSLLKFNESSNELLSFIDSEINN